MKVPDQRKYFENKTEKNNVSYKIIGFYTNASNGNTYLIWSASMDKYHMASMASITKFHSPVKIFMN